MDFWEGVGQLLKGWAEKPNVSSHSVSDAQRELENTYNKTKKDFEDSYLATVKTYDFAVYVLEKSIEYARDESATGLEYIPEPIVEQLLDITVASIKENHLFDFPYMDFSKEIPLSKQIEYKQILNTVSLRVYDNDMMFDLFQTSFSYALSQFLLSSESFIEHGTQSGSFTTSVVSFQKDLPTHVEHIMFCFFTEANAEYGLFENLRNQLLSNADVASGFRPDRTDEERANKPCTLPSHCKLSGKELVDTYLHNTQLQSLFSASVPFAIPISSRMEHTHIIAGTGHGKTQLIQRLILDDLEAGRGCMVIDSQGDMLNKIIMLDYFEPDRENSLSDKLIYINPEDVENPASLNMFSLNTDASNISELDKQILVNSAVDLYQYLFGALFGAELTSKQGIIFRYLAKLMAEIPDATIHTLRALLEDARPYKSYMDKLEGSAKAFFQTQFFTPSFNQTKQQVLSRLWMVLSNQTLENLFSSKENSVDLVSALQEGKIVLVNTSKRLLQDYGSATLGRFFIALLAQAVIQRGTLPEYARDPYMVYVDEAQEYLDEKIENMLNQARKQSVGLCFSHQNLGQLGSYKGTVFSSTSVKLAGGISAKDATDLAHEMKSNSHTLLSVQKTKTHAEFACYIKNQLPTAIPISYAFGQMEQAPKISRDGYVKNAIHNIRKYCTPVDELSFGEVVGTSDTESKAEKPQTQQATPAPQIKTVQAPPDSDEKIQPDTAIGRKASHGKQEKVKQKETPVQVKPELVDVAPEGKGGTTHRYLQNLVKKIGQKRGFHTVVESSVFGGFGSVDIALSGFDTKIAVEVSVHTQGKWESSNVAKCLSAEFDTVVILSSEKQHLEKIQNAISGEFAVQIENGKLRFFQSEQLILFLDEIKADSASQESTVSGYKVTTSFVVDDERETQIREEAIAKVLLNKK